MSALHILAATNSSTYNPAAMMFTAYCIWCWRRHPSPGSTKLLDWAAGWTSAMFCVVGFCIKRRWMLGFLWLAIWTAAIVTQRVLAASVAFGTDQAANSFNSISIISLVLMGWTTGIIALNTSRIHHGVQGFWRDT